MQIRALDVSMTKSSCKSEHCNLLINFNAKFCSLCERKIERVLIDQGINTSTLLDIRVVKRTMHAIAYSFQFGS